LYLTSTILKYASKLTLGEATNLRELSLAVVLRDSILPNEVLKHLTAYVAECKNMRIEMDKAGDQIGDKWVKTDKNQPTNILIN
jgi:hypothetical protein